jgi:hypothetical protein
MKIEAINNTDEDGFTVSTFRGTLTSTIGEGSCYEIDVPGHDLLTLYFQRGPTPEGINGITTEALIKVLIDRTETLNKKFPCEENRLAISSLRLSLYWLEERTRNRQARGVEGQMVV